MITDPYLAASAVLDAKLSVILAALDGLASVLAAVADSVDVRIAA